MGNTQTAPEPRRQRTGYRFARTVRIHVARRLNPDQPEPRDRGGRGVTTRDVAISMLQQRVDQAKARGIYPPEVKQPESGRHARRLTAGRTDIGVSSLYPAYVVAGIVLAFGLTFGSCRLFNAEPVLTLILTSVGPTAALAVGILAASGVQMRRLAAQSAARFDNEVNAMPEDGAIAMQRAENLVERTGVETRLVTQRLLRDLFLAAVFIIPVVGLAAFGTLGNEQAVTVVATCIFETLAIGGFLVSRQRMRELEGDRRQADYERSLLVEDAFPEERAEKLFLRQQFELKRYYDETLRQSSTLSYIGTVCLAGGFAVIGVAFYLVVSADDEPTRQIVVAALGTAGGLLANFVAFVFLKMHSDTVQALTSFHERLVGTHHVHFGNVLASRISNDLTSEQRQVLGQMALSLSTAATPETGSAESPATESPKRFIQRAAQPRGRGPRRA